MNEFIQKITEKAKANPKRVLFAEGMNTDILKTAELTLSLGIGFPVLVGNRSDIEKKAQEDNINTSGFEYFDPTGEEERTALAREYVQKFDDFTEKSVIRKSKDPVCCAMFLLKLHKADCAAAGKEYSTGDVVFNAVSIVGLQKGVESPSSLGLADIPGFAGSEGCLLGLADCAITAQPDAKDLAGITIASASTAHSLLGWEPRVAMLAFSTCGSAEHESIDVIRNAITHVHELDPKIKVDGEFQLDAALFPDIAAKKVRRESEVAGRANILIFPNLHAGNIGVKLIQFFGQANAYGPMLQGFARPVCDFSRSAPVEEMLGNVAMLVVRAHAEKDVY